MSQGLYTKAQVANYLECRPQEVARMIEEDGLPVVSIPCAKRPVDKITLHGLHGWLSQRASGAAFMSVEELAAEIAAANAKDMVGSLGMLTLRSAVELVFESVKTQMERSAA
ncbi:hypothetical protein [Prosthecobacter sp.]|uniref:hypothetical protein n=1 Tax=Prosthecobacter sp. TaxID=1965333 RepID=UPI00378300DC